MGIEDRDYYRSPRGGLSVKAPRSIIGWVILINVVIFLLDGLLREARISHILALEVGSLGKPWLWWQFLTYGFTHASFPDYWHVLGNMLGLFFLGRFIEQLYGSKEFLRLYLSLIVISGIVWAVASWAEGASPNATAVGASGAVVGVVMLFALNFPRQTVLLFFVVPVPAWVLGVLLVLNDLNEAFKSSGSGGSHIAWQAHMAGAAFAFLYFKRKWRLTRLTDRLTGGLPSLKSRPKLRVHDPDRHDRREHELREEVDRILKKIHRQGESSLTKRERRTMENASRKYQRKRQDDEKH